MTDSRQRREAWLGPPGARMNEPQNVAFRSPSPLGAFAIFMQRELDANGHKGDRDAWRKIPPKELLLQIGWHAVKLGAAMRDGDCDGIAEYAADIACVAMMIADAYGLL